MVTVCNMVAAAIGMSREEVEVVIREIRADKYFENRGTRTPLSGPKFLRDKSREAMQQQPSILTHSQ